MATVTIYYSREDQKYGDWDLYLIPGNQNTSGLLFPDEEIESYYSDYPRKKMSFSIAGTLGYVNIDTNTAQKCGFYIKRKDGYMDYSGNLSIGDPDYEDYYSKIAGDVYNIDTRFVSTGYVRPNDQYLYTSDSFTTIHPQAVRTLPAEGEDDEFAMTKRIEIHYDYINKFIVAIPDNENNINTHLEMGVSNYDDLVLLYLEGKTYNVGENMDLSIDSDALNVEKADALQIVDKQIANALYQIGEVPADFDEAAFLADVDAYKATKDVSLGNTIDYLKVRLDARANLT